LCSFCLQRVCDPVMIRVMVSLYLWQFFHLLSNINILNFTSSMHCAIFRAHTKLKNEGHMIIVSHQQRCSMGYRRLRQTAILLHQKLVWCLVPPYHPQLCCSPPFLRSFRGSSRNANQAVCSPPLRAEFRWAECRLQGSKHEQKSNQTKRATMKVEVIIRRTWWPDLDPVTNKWEQKNEKSVQSCSRLGLSEQSVGGWQPLLVRWSDDWQVMIWLTLSSTYHL